jgi:DNA-binding response OmpR family regulator
MLSSHKEGFYEITMKLFILEDELAMLEVLTKYCMSNGFEVTSWSEGMVAGKKILAAKPDLIIIDSLIPGKTGLQALGDARKLGVTAPAIFLALLLASSTNYLHSLGQLLSCAAPKVPNSTVSPRR